MSASASDGHAAVRRESGTALPKTMTDGYESWRNVGVATTSVKQSVLDAAQDALEHRAQAHAY